MPRSSSTRRAPLVVALSSAVVVALVVVAALVGYQRASKAGPYLQSGRPSTVITSVLPAYENCGSTPTFEPAIVQTCGARCYAVVLEIHWTTWTTTRAQGTGTFGTNLHQRGCAHGVPIPPTARPGTTIVLRNPEVLSFCARNGRDEFVEHDQTIFTVANLLPSLDLQRRPCSRAQAPRQ
jgi:hypothetical protein